MTAQILNFRRSDSSLPHTRETDRPLQKSKSRIEIFVEAADDVAADWQRDAKRNRLNEYIKSILPPRLQTAGVDYVNDLATLSEIEQELGMAVLMFYPGCTEDNPRGWSSAFQIQNEVYGVPQNMPSEASSRALNICVFQVFTIRLLAADLL